MSVGTPVDILVNPTNPAQYYALWGGGRIDAYGGAPPIVGQQTWYDWVYQPVARAIWITNWTTGAGYMLDMYGAFQPLNGAPALGSSNIVGGVPYTNPSDPYNGSGNLYVDWAWDPAGTGQGYVMDQYGQLYGFGGATAAPRSGPKWPIPVGKKLQMRWTPDKRGVMLDERGGLHGEFNVTSFGSLGNSWPNSNNARDFVVTDWTAPSGYKLDLFGGVHAFGTAVTASGFPYRPGADVARCLAVLSASNPLKMVEVWSGGQQYVFISSTPPTVVAGGGVSEVQSVSMSGTPTGGTFTLTFNGQTTSAIAYNATATTVQTALRALSGIGSTGVTVTGGPGPGTAWSVAFGGTLAVTDVPAMTATSSLTGGTGGTSEVQQVTITGTPTGGTFTLTFSGQTTAAIAFNATAATVQTALRALANIGSTGVNVTGGPGPGTAWVVTFAGGLASSDQPQMTATSSLTGGTSPTVTVTTTTPGVNTPVTIVTTTGGINASPSASVTTTTRPVLGWSYSDPQGDTQAAWQLYVYTQTFANANSMVDPSVWVASAVVADDGIDPNARGLTSPVDFTNGSYRLFVRSQDTAGSWSAWSSWDWTQAVPLPTTPTGLTATANQTAFTVALSVTATTGGSANLIRFDYSDDGGTTWAPVVGAEAVTLAATTTATDRFPPMGITRTYRAVAYATNPRVASVPSTTATATITARVYALHALTNSALGGQVEVQGPVRWTRPTSRGKFQGLGADYPIILKDGSTPRARTTTLTVLAETKAARLVVEALLESTQTLVYRDPFGRVLFCEMFGDWDMEQLEAAPLLSESTPLRDFHAIPIPLVEIKPPIKGF